MRKIYLAVLCFLLFALAGYTQTTVPFTTAGANTWFCPAGVTSITVEGWGGGGAGGGATGSPSAGGGGAGGAYTKNTFAVTPGITYNLFVGAGGIGTAGAGLSGNSSWFNTNTTLLAIGGTGGALANANSQTAAGATAPITGNIGGSVNFYGGNGGTGGASGASGGGGGGSAGTIGNGNAATGITGGTVVTGGGAGANGATTSANGANATALGGGGAGAHAGNGTNRSGGNGFTGKVLISYSTPGTYKSQLVSMNLGSANWCLGETRNISVTIKNVGTATWVDAPGQDISVGIKWNTNGANWTDYYIRTDVGTVLPGNQATYNFTITASNNIGAGYTTPLAAGINNLTFDIVYEGVSWFGDNNGGVGPGNNRFPSPNQTISSFPQGSLSGNTICTTSGTGQLTFTATAGTGPFTVVYDDGVTNQTAINISSGTPFNVVSNPATTTSYTLVSITNSAAAGSCVRTSGFTGGTANITVNTPASITTNPVSQIKCTGQSVTVSVAASGSSPTYQWRKNGANITGATSASYTIASVATTDAASYDVLVAVAGCGSVMSAVATLTVNTSPTITTQPAASQTKCVGSSATFSVTANGSPSPTYQWKKNNVDITGATGSSYTINPVSSSDAATYTVVVTNSCSSVTSGGAALTVNTPVSISTQPLSQIKCTGQTATFNVTLSAGSSPTYQWRKNGTNIGGATSSSYTTPVLVAGDNGNTYDVVITVASCGSVTSSAATLTVNTNSTISLSSAAGTDGQTVCKNDAVINITYAIGGGGTGAIISAGALPGGVTGSFSGGVFTISGIPIATGTFNYTVTTQGPCINPSLSGSIIVKAIPSGTLTATEISGSANNDNTICSGASVTFTATSGYAAYNFKVNGTSVQTGTSNIYSTVTLTNGASVTVDVANSLNCGATFGPIVITVIALPTPALMAAENSGIPNNNVICAGSNVTFTAGGGTSYVFKVNGSSVQSGASNTFSSTTLTNGASVTVAVTNSNGCTAVSVPIIITVNAVPAGTLSTPSTSVCAGDNVIFTATAGFANYDFRINGSSIQNSVSNTFSTSTLANASVVTVVVTNSSGCSATFNAIAVTVNPLPAGTVTVTENSGTPDDNSICAGAPVTFTFNSGYANYNFKVNGVSQQNGSSVSYINSTLNSGDVVTVVITSGSNCSATVTAPAITIVTSPTGSLTFSPSSICAGDNVVLTATAGFANYNFQVNNASVQNGSSNTFSSTTLANGDVITVDVTNSNTCTTTFNSITLIIDPLPTGTLIPLENSGNMPNDGTICTGATVVFTAPSGYSNYDFILNGGTIQSGASNTYSNNALINGDYIQVAITNANSCIGLLNTVTVMVNALPAVAPITGTFDVCVNSTITLADATSGGIWSSLNTAVATVDAAGVVTGVSAGTATINYTFANTTTGCSNTVSATVTVNAPPTVAPISGNLNVCTGTSSQLTDATAGGVWSSSNTAIATVNSSGLVDGISAGTATISYTVTDGNGCTTIVTADVTVSNLPSVAPITGSTNVCVGSATALSDATTGGIWSSDNISVATVNSSGQVTGIAAGTATISYTITTTCATTVSATVTMTVTAPPSATIAYTGGPFCTTAAPVSVNQTGTIGGTYSSTSGLTINSANGTITPATSSGGTYTVTYTIPAAGGCGVYTTTTSVTISKASSATITYNGGSFCTSSAPVNVTRTGTAGGTYSSAAGLTLNAATGTITPATSTGGGYTVTYTIAASGNCAAFTTTTSVTITTAPSATISYAGGTYCTSAAPVNVTRTGTAGGTYTSSAGLTLNAATGTITPASSTGGTYIVTYTIAASGGCAVFTTTTSVTVNPLPTATISGTTGTCLNSVSPNITFTGAGGTAPYTFTYKINAGGNLTVTSVGNMATIAAPTNTLGTFTYTLISVQDASSTACTQNQGGTAVITVNAPPAAFIISPAGAAICTGDVQPLTATSSTPTNGSATISSGAINIGIPDATFFGLIPGTVTTNMTVSGIPAGAVINSISVNFNINHTYDGDLVLNIKAPNGNVLNLVNNRGGSANNFINTNISSTGVTPVNSGSAPFTGTYSADASNGQGTPLSNVTAFSSLYSTPNGTWVFGAQDDGVGDVGTITSWSITFNYTIPTSALPVAWSPFTSLYTDAGATIAYSGQSLSTVYSKPTTSGSIIYTATATNGANCSTTKTVILTVNPRPVVIISADYCIVAGKVRLTANATPAATGYIWSTGATTQSIDVDVAGAYTVTAFGAGSCPGTATINIATELVTNGDFSAGNTGFVTEYGYTADVAGNNELLPEGLYGIGTSGQNYHPSFYGKEHSTPGQTGNFMLINGSTTLIGSPARQRIIWEQTITVLPNTNYYFSAWGMNLNPGSPAQLRFEVNGVQVGTIADLNIAPKPTSNAAVNINNWVRFYSNPTWTSGPTTTTAVVRIINLNTTPGGNDFGLDDISFGTLSTFITLESAPGTDAQTPCINTAITNIVYSTGSSASGPTITGLPAGVTSSFNGELLTISGTPTVAGNYSYTITTTGSCNPSTATGTITVKTQTITLSSGSNSPSVCTNTPVNISYTFGGTATGATVSGLPTGVTSSVTGTILTISGTPTVAGSYSYSITTSGTCAPATATGTINVQAQIITLNTGNNTQTICINSSIANIQYSISGSGNGAAVSGLPPGVTGTYSGGFFIINGTPTSAAGSPYNYTVTTTGTSCAAATSTGTITVTPGGSFSLTSGAGTNSQTVCKGAAILNITYAVNNATGASITGLPAGITGTFGSGVFTISGTTTAIAGTYNYTVTTSGGCAQGTATGSVIVQAQTITLTSGNASPSVCANTLMPNIVYTIGGTATTATVSGLPAGTSGVLSGNVFTISGTPIAPAGPYTYAVTLSGTCATVTATGTITIQPGAVGGNLTSVSICNGGSGSLTLSGQTGSVQRWEYSINGGTTWTSITNTTITQTFTNVTVPTLYRAVVSNGCNPVFSSVATLGIHNLWTGATNTDWFTASNWSDGLVPSTSCPDVTIPAVIAPNVYPLLNAGIATINNLIIKPTASFTITGGTLQVAGSINNSGTFNTLIGTIEMNGSAAQTIAANTFMNNDVKNLIVSNTNTAGVTVGGPLNIYGKISFGNGNNKVLASAGFINLKSNAAGTAMIADVTSGNPANNNNRITGNVVVERYFPGRRAWRLLTAPVSTTRTIYNEWQLGGTMATTAPGSGTLITKPFGTGTPTDGLEQSNNSSLKTFNLTTGQLVDVANTHVPVSNNAQQVNVPDNIGYFMFVRGDRTPSLLNPYPITNFNITTLRDTGVLQTGMKTFGPVAAGNFMLIGNPYASPVDFGKLTRTNVDKKFWAWDPRLNATLGAYTFVDGQTGPGYIITPAPDPIIGTTGQDSIIQSSQAFFVQATGTGSGSVVFNENYKSTKDNNTVFRPARSAAINETYESLRANLYLNEGDTAILADGVYEQYSNSFSADIDGLDGLKFTNFLENFGIASGGKTLILERRPLVTEHDTIFFKLWNTTERNYQFRFITSGLNHPGLEGYLEDSYLKTSTPVVLNGYTNINFSVTSDALSKVRNRFRIVFKTILTPLPVTFTSVKAYQHGNSINVEWNVANEINMQQYEVERSTDGSSFIKVAAVPAIQNNSGSAKYQWPDASPVNGMNYYRIRSVSLNGEIQYSNIVKVDASKPVPSISIYPNPVTNGIINVHLVNQPQGRYMLRLMNKLGQVIMIKEVQHAEGTTTETLQPGKTWAHGTYQLEVTKPDNSKTDFNVLY